MSGKKDPRKCWWQGWESRGMWSEQVALDQTLPGASWTPSGQWGWAARDLMGLCIPRSECQALNACVSFQKEALRDF